MKKLLILSLSLLLSGNLLAEVSLSDFAFDEAAFTEEMAPLNQLEMEVQQHGWDLTDVTSKTNSQATLGNLNLQHAGFSVDDMDWNSFAWGFCCWPVGFFVVAINDSKSSDQKLSFWIGMGVNVVLSTISALSAPAGTFTP